MVLHLIIREKNRKDEGVIRTLIDKAFLGRPYSHGTEGVLVESLCRQSALAVSLLAEVDSQIVGHIAFSPGYPEDGAGGWYALGPVAVLPSLQRQGIGFSLVARGLAALAGMHAAGCILVGDARYYSHFGFENMPHLAPSTEPAEYFMVKLLAGPLPKTPAQFHQAFVSAA